MSSEIASIKVGDINCWVITDGESRYDFENIQGRFPDVPREDLIESLKARHGPDGRVGWSMNCLLIETGGRWILVDTGVGPGGSPNSGLLHDRLLTIRPAESIDRVIITHGHPDHIGGLTDNRGELRYPNADYLMWADEWAHWMGEHGIASRNPEWAEQFRPKLDPIQDRLTLIEEEGEVADGVTSIAAFGHTPGHMGLLIESRGERLLDLVDSLHTAVQLDHPHWSPRFDVEPERAAETRRSLLQRTANEAILTLIYHFPFPGLGWIRTAGKAYDWKVQSKAT